MDSNQNKTGPQPITPNWKQKRQLSPQPLKRSASNELPRIGEHYIKKSTYANLSVAPVSLIHSIFIDDLEPGSKIREMLVDLTTKVIEKPIVGCIHCLQLVFLDDYEPLILLVLKKAPFYYSVTHLQRLTGKKVPNLAIHCSSISTSLDVPYQFVCFEHQKIKPFENHLWCHFMTLPFVLHHLFEENAWKYSNVTAILSGQRNHDLDEEVELAEVFKNDIGK